MRLAQQPGQQWDKGHADQGNAAARDQLLHALALAAGVILSICIFLVTYGRMIEIYVVTALGPIPLATMGSSEWRSTGQNYLKSLLALGFQAFLIMIVVGIYAVLIRNISGAADIAGAIWGCMGYTVLLCFCLFKTGSISKSVFGTH